MYKALSTFYLFLHHLFISPIMCLSCLVVLRQSNAPAKWTYLIGLAQAIVECSRNIKGNCIDYKQWCCLRCSSCLLPLRDLDLLYKCNIQLLLLFSNVLLFPMKLYLQATRLLKVHCCGHGICLPIILLRMCFWVEPCTWALMLAWLGSQHEPNGYTATALT